MHSLEVKESTLYVCQLPLASADSSTVNFQANYLNRTNIQLTQAKQHNNTDSKEQRLQWQSDRIVNILIKDNSISYYSAYPVDHKHKSGKQLCLTKFLNSSSPSEIPPHILNLKRNTTATLIRNLNISDGLVNGTRMIVKVLHEHVEITRSEKLSLYPAFSYIHQILQFPSKHSDDNFRSKLCWL